MNGTCAAGTEYKRVVCTEDKDCGEGTNGVCGACNGLTGERVCGAAEALDDCSSVWRKAMSCYESKKCAPVPGSQTTTCAQEDCTTVTNDVLGCKTNCLAFRSNYGSCAAGMLLHNCPKYPTWARITIAFSVLLAIIIIVFAIYCVSRVMSTKQYNPLESK